MSEIPRNENVDSPNGKWLEVCPLHLNWLNIAYNVLFQANITRTNHIMWTMGTDFKYQYAQSWFRQMDKFIHYVNQVTYLQLLP